VTFSLFCAPTTHFRTGIHEIKKNTFFILELEFLLIFQIQNQNKRKSTTPTPQIFFPADKYGGGNS
jgi:hypothetical protein